MPNIYVRLASNLKRGREASGLTLEELAGRASVSPTYLSHIMRGRKKPTLEVVDRLAGALGLDVADLLGSEPAQAGAEEKICLAELTRALKGRSSAQRKALLALVRDGVALLPRK